VTTGVSVLRLGVSTPPFARWLLGRPADVVRCGLRYPPGTVLGLGGRTLHVLGYREGGTLIVSEADPATDYDAADASREYLCVGHVTDGGTRG
jgi:hypothetical protein